MTYLSILLETLQFVVPSLVVYFLMKEFYKGHNIIETIKLKATQKNETLPLRMQAYERLSLLLERIKLPSQVMRLQTPSAQAEDLKKALLISIQKEFEHNLTQQIYISEKLWEIILVAKNSTLDLVNQAHNESGGDSMKFNEFLLSGYHSHLEGIIFGAQSALRKEVELFFK